MKVERTSSPPVTRILPAAGLPSASTQLVLQLAVPSLFEDVAAVNGSLTVWLALVVSAVPPLTPLVRSHARKVRPLVTVLLKFAFGTNRTKVLASAESSRAVAAVGLPKAFQVDPPSMEYCQTPLLLSTPVTAIPVSAPALASLTWPAMRSTTYVPPFAVLSSRIVPRSFAPASTGALFGPAGLRESAPALASLTWPA